ncbi:zinc finger protein 667 isoform X8 [Diceros bicornis minor]|uniref:zinc finger protein 667 isoform X8 n=1 Tax=Diceros bicornis minor TaxID=77932 RepID=UPI0026EE7BF9|nr:zinc finger protein 667 isoform X8 [Diceros bicornis minor]
MQPHVLSTRPLSKRRPSRGRKGCLLHEENPSPRTFLSEAKCDHLVGEREGALGGGASEKTPGFGEKGVEVFNYDSGFIYFSLWFLQFLSHVV